MKTPFTSLALTLSIFLGSLQPAFAVPRQGTPKVQLTGLGAAPAAALPSTPNIPNLPFGLIPSVPSLPGPKDVPAGETPAPKRKAKAPAAKTTPKAKAAAPTPAPAAAKASSEDQIAAGLSALEGLIKDPANLSAGQQATVSAILYGAFDRSRKKKGEVEVDAPAKDDSSAPKGLLRHGEHWVDLILAQGSSADTRYLKAYQELARSLLKQAKAGKVDLVNEKIDGSPSVAFGFTEAGKPFVTYKCDFDRVSKEQRFVTSYEDAKRFFPMLHPMYGNLIELFGPKMAALATEFGDYVFQGDLLFYPGAVDRGAKTEKDGVIQLAPNTVLYEIKPGHPLYSRLQGAKIGVVIHSVGRKTAVGGGRFTVEAAENVDKRALVEKFVSALDSSEGFAEHPWKADIKVGTERTLEKATETKVSQLLLGIERKLGKLTPEYREAFSRHEIRFRTYFNSFLKEPHRGGIYKAAAEGQAFSFQKILDGFLPWFTARTVPKEEGKKPTEDAAKVRGVIRLLAGHRDALEILMSAYFDAIQVQYLLLPHVREILSSKLGGGESEGVMLETSDTIVKFVDRLGFTMANNAKNRRGPRPGPVQLDTGRAQAQPYARWAPGTAFVIAKMQPVHAGHVAMVKEAIRLNSGGETVVVLSDKTHNLTAKDWKGLKVADTKKKLVARDYTYVFSQSLRRRILEASLPAGTKIYFTATNEWTVYLSRAQQAGEAGKVKRVVGQKEMDEKRFDYEFEKYGSHLEPLVVPMQNGGISGTDVRNALKASVLGTAAEKKVAKEVLEAALASIPTAKDRAAIMMQMIAEWKAVDEKVQALVGP